MALFVVFSFLFSSSLVNLAVAQDNETVATKVDMKCRCNSIGFKFVNIIWQPLPQDANSHFETVYYNVFYCTPGLQCNGLADGQYQLGCTLNITHETSEQEELQCTIRAQTLFGFRFYFILEMRNSSGVFISSRKKTCRLGGDGFKCTKPQNFRIQASGKRNFTVSWEPAREMGPQTPLLCYRIWYASEQNKANESVQISAAGEMILSHTIEDLHPYTKYTFFIQCSLSDCYNGWGAFTGPVTGMTKEEAPAQAPKFENWSVSNVDEDKRDVTLVWKLPPSNTWNGVPTKFEINYWQVPSQENGSLPNSSRSIQINNGSARITTLVGLNRFVDYQSEISMCTSEGCGPKSIPWDFQADVRGKKINKLHNSDSSGDSVAWIIIGVSLSVGVILLVIVAYNYIRKRRHRRNRQPLDEILQMGPPPPSYDDLFGSELSTQNSYAEIHEVDAEDALLQQSSQTQQDNGVSDT